MEVMQGWGAASEAPQPHLPSLHGRVFPAEAWPSRPHALAARGRQGASDIRP